MKHRRVFLGHKEEENCAICRKINVVGHHCVEGNSSSFPPPKDKCQMSPFKCGNRGDGNMKSKGRRLSG